MSGAKEDLDEVVDDIYAEMDAGVTIPTAESTSPVEEVSQRPHSDEVSQRLHSSWGIVGYRHYTDRATFDAELERLVEERGLPDRVVSGGAPGADTMARDWAAERRIPCTEHKPRAPTAVEFKARNTLIVRDSTLVIAFVSHRSKGTYDTINKAIKMGRPLVRIQLD